MIDPRIICRVGVVFLIAANAFVAFGQSDTVNSQSENPLWCPPYGTNLPPDRFRLRMPPLGKRHGQGHMFSSFEDYPAYAHAFPATKDNVIGMHVYFAGRPIGLWHDLGADVDWEWSSFVPDGHAISVGGQVYTCDSSSRMLTRRPDHTRSIAPSNAVGILPVPTDGSLELTGPNYTLGRRFDLRLSIARFEQPRNGESSGGRVRLALFSGEDRVLAPCTWTKHVEHPGLKIAEHSMWVAEGQYIETTYWRLKLVRIVFPDPDHGIDGWADVFIDLPATNPNRPPAPNLPEDDDAL